jgi:solute carrier family 25 oxoglutarate transporter 11
MASYDQAKELVTQYVTHDSNSLSTSLISSAIAGFCCALFSQPPDLLKSRLMNMKIDPVTKQMPYSGIMDCIRKTIQREGLMGFMKGFPAYYARCAPHAMVILVSNEPITRGYRRIFGIDSAKKHDMVTASRFHSAGAVISALHDDKNNQDDDDGNFAVLDDDEESE